MVPSWDWQKTDYTVLCDSPVEFQITARSKMSFDGAPARKGSWSESVDLLPGQGITLRSLANGKSYSVRCRPSNMPLASVQRSGPVQGKFYLTAPNASFTGMEMTHYPMILDEYGTPVWWTEDNAGFPIDIKALGPKTLAWTRGVGAFSIGNTTNHYDLRNLDGSLRKTVSPVGMGADHHDLDRTPDGNWLLISYVPRNCPSTPSDCEDLSAWGGPENANVIDCVIQKVSPSGQMLWSWNSGDHIAIEESAPWIPSLASKSPPIYDIVHMNSVESVPGGLVFSARHLDAIYKIRYSDGGVDWKLGGTETPESLQVVGDPLGANTLSGNHDARMLANGNVTIHDNGTRFGRAPRMVRFAIKGDKAVFKEQITDSAIEGSFCCGGGRKLPGGNWVINWGASAQVGEYTPSGKKVLSLTWPGDLFSYRMDPAPFLSLQDLRDGMDQQFPR